MINTGTMLISNVRCLLQTIPCIRRELYMFKYLRLRKTKYKHKNKYIWNVFALI